MMQKEKGSNEKKTRDRLSAGVGAGNERERPAAVSNSTEAQNAEG